MSAVCHDTLCRTNPPQIKLLLLSWANELWNALFWGTFCAAGPTEIVAFPAATIMFVTYTALFANIHDLSLSASTLPNPEEQTEADTEALKLLSIVKSRNCSSAHTCTRVVGHLRSSSRTES